MEEHQEKTIEPKKVLAEQMWILNTESKKEATTALEKVEISRAIVTIYESLKYI